MNTLNAKLGIENIVGIVGPSLPLPLSHFVNILIPART